MFGVRRFNSLTHLIPTLHQRKSLYVYDPKAVHQIIVKDQDTFEEPPIVMVYAMTKSKFLPLLTLFRIRQMTFGMGLLGTEGASPN